MIAGTSPAHAHPRSIARRRLGLALFAVSFGTNVSTPLLLLYQRHFGLSTWTVTALFAVYPVALTPVLLWAGPASDVRGRKPIVATGVVLSAAASALFIAGQHHVAVLFVARALLGIVSGLVFGTASAWMQELADHADPLWAARVTGMLLYAGFGGGPILGGLLGQWAPWPLVLPYFVHIALVAAGVLALRGVHETVIPDPSRAVRFHLGIPQANRRAFATVVVPTALGVFGFASLSFGLFPVLLRPAMPGIAVVVSGVVGGITAGSIFATQGLLVRLGAPRAASLALLSGAAGCGLGAIAFATDWWWLLFVAAVLLGSGSGLAVTSGLRFVDQLTTVSTRGALTGTFYVVAYAAMTMPVIVSSIGHSRITSVAVLGVVSATALAGGVVVRASAVHLRRPTSIDRLT